MAPTIDSTAPTTTCQTSGRDATPTPIDTTDSPRASITTRLKRSAQCEGEWMRHDPPMEVTATMAASSRMAPNQIHTCAGPPISAATNSAAIVTGNELKSVSRICLR